MFSLDYPGLVMGEEDQHGHAAGSQDGPSGASFFSWLANGLCYDEDEPVPASTRKCQQPSHLPMQRQSDYCDEYASKKALDVQPEYVKTQAQDWRRAQNEAEELLQTVRNRKSLLAPSHEEQATEPLSPLSVVSHLPSPPPIHEA